MKRLLRPDRLVAVAILAAAAGVVLLMPAGVAFGSPRGDLTSQFAPWRAFAAASIHAGHLPLWNPYTYAGEPFLGGFQSAVLYPPNAVFLVLPLARAINASIFLHLLILAWGMYRWALRRGLHPAAAGACGAILTLGGAVFPHIYAGHLSNICTMAWAPWILGGLESWWTERRRAGLFEASAAICLQILAGHVQYVFFTGIAAGLHALVWSAADGSARRRAVPAVAGCYAVAAALAAAQLLPGFAAASEGIRQGKLGFAFASMFSFPPENFLTLVAPGFFGDFLHNPYWGRWYISEMEVFVGAAGLVLVATGAFVADARRRARLDLTLAGLLFLLALGANTPLYNLLYDFVPGIGQFRGMSKFVFPAMIFVALALGAGADALIRRRPIPRWLAFAAFGASVLLVGSGLMLLVQPESVGDFIRGLRATNQDYLPEAALTNHPYLHESGMRAGGSLAVAGAVFLLAGGSLLWAGRRPWLRWAPLVLLGVETMLFCSGNFATTDPSIAAPDEMRRFIAQHPGDYRVLTLIYPGSGYNSGFLLGASDLWGNDPSVLRRYAEFITFTQGYDPNQTTQYIPGFRSLPPLYAMLRCRYAFAPNDGRIQTFESPAPPMARAQLISDFRVLGGRDAVFAAMSDPAFDPRRTVLLESEPVPRPVPGADPGSVRVTEISADSLTMVADVAEPTLLLVTDPYSRDWRAVPLPGSSQQSYTVLPADYVVRAVPLAAGHHRILMEYAPPSFLMGAAISTIAWIGWLCAAWLSWRRGGEASA